MAVGRSIKKQDIHKGQYADRYSLNRRLKPYGRKRMFAEQALLQGPGKTRWSTATRRRKVKADPRSEVSAQILRAAMVAVDVVLRSPPVIVDAKPLGGG